MHYKSMGLLILALFCGIVCSMAVKQIFIAPSKSNQPLDATVPQVQILIAKKDLVAGTELTPQNVRFAAYPENKAPKDAIMRYAGIEKRRVVRSVAKNEPISLFDLEIESEIKESDTLFVPPGHVVVPVRIEGVTSGIGFGDIYRFLKLEKLLLPGDKVVLSTVQEEAAADGANKSGSPLKLVLKTLVDGADIYKITTETTPSAGGSLKKTSVISVLLNRENAEQVKNAAKDGKLRLTLMEKKAPESGQMALSPGGLNSNTGFNRMSAPAASSLQGNAIPFRLQPGVQNGTDSEPIRTAQLPNEVSPQEPIHRNQLPLLLNAPAHQDAAPVQVQRPAAVAQSQPASETPALPETPVAKEATAKSKTESAAEPDPMEAKNKTFLKDIKSLPKEESTPSQQESAIPDRKKTTVAELPTLETPNEIKNNAAPSGMNIDKTVAAGTIAEVQPAAEPAPAFQYLYRPNTGAVAEPKTDKPFRQIPAVTVPRASNVGYSH